MSGHLVTLLSQNFCIGTSVKLNKRTEINASGGNEIINKGKRTKTSFKTNTFTDPSLISKKCMACMIYHLNIITYENDRMETARKKLTINYYGR